MKGWGKYGVVISLVLAVSILAIGPTAPAPAVAGDTGLEVAVPVLGTLAAAAAGYILWYNRPGNQGNPWPIPGEFYVGGFLGVSIPAGGACDFRAFQRFEISDLDLQPGVVGGMKFGYLCPYFPYAGLEAEANFTRNDIRSQDVNISPPLHGQTFGKFQTQQLSLFTLALRPTLRYGFFPDKDVSTFGRLQPYVGVGPGFVQIFSRGHDSENLSLEPMAGLRWMCLKNVSCFVEYQFSYIFQGDFYSVIRPTARMVEGSRGNFRDVAGSTINDWEIHKVIAGFAYHF